MTKELIERLQKLDPEGNKAVGIDVEEANDMKTDLTISVYGYWIWITAK